MSRSGPLWCSHMEIQIRGLAGQLDAEQQVGEPGAQLLVDEARGLHLQRGEVDVPHHRGRQHRAQELDRVLGLRERVLEQGVVRRGAHDGGVHAARVSRQAP